MRRLATLALLLCACASGKPAPQPPTAPSGVTARPGDGQVTLLWGAVDGALTYKVYENGAASDVGSVTSWTVTGLTNGVSYSFAVSAVGVGGESALSAAVSATPVAAVKLAVASIAPADSATAVARNTAIKITFNAAIDPSTVTAGCSGSVQVSDDNFATCAAGTVSTTATTATFTPAGPLHGNATYKARVTTAVKDANELPLSATYTSNGFTTAPELTATIGALGNAAPLNPSITVTFNRAVTQGSITSCGTVYLYVTAGNCLPMTVTFNGNSASFAPQSPLASGTQYTFVVTTGVLDSDGVALAAQVTSQFATGFGVTSVTPADGSTSVARNINVVVNFNGTIDSSTVTPGCNGSLEISDDNFATCAAGTFTTTASSITFTPSAALHGGATYKVRVTTALKNTNGLPIAVQFTSAGFTTAAALTVTIAPLGNAAPLTPSIVVTFNRSAANVSATLCAGTCVGLSHSQSGNVWTFQPTAALQTSTAYTFTVPASVTDSDGVPLAAAATMQFTTEGAASVTSTDLQHISLTWTAQNGVTVSYAATDGSSTGSQTFSGTTGVLGPLLPGKTWNLTVTPTSGNATTIDGVTCALDGSAADFLGSQTSGSFALAWSNDHLFAAYENTLGGDNGDALWIAVDAGLGTGEWQTATGAAGAVIWPFKADYVIELKNAGGTTQTNLRTVATNSWAALESQSLIGPSLAQIGAPLSAIGSPSSARVALAAVATNNSYVFDSQPAPAAGHIGFIGTSASLTDSYSVNFSAQPSAIGTVTAAASLVSFTLTGVPNQLLKGSIAPLSYASPVALPMGTGAINFGAVKGELFFKFYDGTTDEFTPGSDRVYTLSGGADVIPSLTFNTAYSATHSFTLVFNLNSGGTPTDILGSTLELGNWTPTNGAPLSGGPSAWTTGAVVFSHHDFTATPLGFKAYYQGADMPYEGGADHTMNDDVINARTLTWSAGDGTSF